MNQTFIELYLECCGNYLSPVMKSVAKTLFGSLSTRKIESLSPDERQKLLKLSKINLSRAKANDIDIGRALRNLETQLTTARAQGVFSDIFGKSKTQTKAKGQASKFSKAPSQGVIGRKQSSSNFHATLSTIDCKIESTADIISARFAALNLAMTIGFRRYSATRIATAVSELARNIALYVGNGTIQIKRISKSSQEGISINAIDHGNGIDNLSLVLTGDYRSTSGLGIGLKTVRDMADEFDIQSTRSGTRVRFVKWST